MPVPLIATYRLQLNPEFTFREGAALASYLQELGISHMYASPIFQAVPGSAHGYDVVDPARPSEDLGGSKGLDSMTEALQEHNLGLVLDIVPNHMSIQSRLNRWWWDVLENGPSSRFAAHFDVDWEASEASPANRILLPVLGDHYGRTLDQGEITIQRRQAAFHVCYYEHEFPLAPRSLVYPLHRAAQRLGSEELAFLVDCLHNLPLPTVKDRKNRKLRHRNKEVVFRYLEHLLDSDPRAEESVDAVLNEINNDPEALDALLEHQNYRLCFWRTAGRDIGYRRFFDINTLVGLRVEDEEVFTDTHALVLRWLNEGRLDGLRIDHPDGLRDPEQYFRRLRHYSSEVWIVAEKILHPGEKLRSSWPIQGTTGYDFSHLTTGLFLNTSARDELTEFYTAFTAEPAAYGPLLEDKKRQVLQELFASDVHRLCDVLRSICTRHRRFRDYTFPEIEAAIMEILVLLPVYRTYIRPDSGHIDPEDMEMVDSVLTSAQERLPHIDPALFAWIRKILILEQHGELETEFVARLQQLSAPAMAKGAEDTAFYCYNRFVAANEVGGDPGTFGMSPASFHQTMQDRLQSWPTAMSSTSTHDTKRSEDVRARLAVLSEIPDKWAERVRDWAGRTKKYKTEGRPDRNMEYLLYQSLVGAWPIDEDRMQDYAQKAAREAKMHTSWTRVNVEYEESLSTFIRSLYRDSDFLDDISTFVDTIRRFGWMNSLAQTALKLACPGIPDIYQGLELWDLSLVDPDNRRQVDFTFRRNLLRELEDMSAADIVKRMPEGLPKMWLIRQGLHLRHRLPQAFGPAGSYTPLFINGAKAEHALAFVRGDEVVCLVPRLTCSLDQWADTTVHLPENRWHNVLTGEAIDGGPRPVQEVLHTFPVALLVKTMSASGQSGDWDDTMCKDKQ